MRDLEKNKENAIAFYKMAFEGNPVLAASKYLGDRYIQHNPRIGDGITPCIEYFEKLDREFPRRIIEFIRTITEEDLVVLHTRQIWGDKKESVTIIIFRFDDKGKIIEHWDAREEIPENSANNNTMY